MPPVTLHLPPHTPRINTCRDLRAAYGCLARDLKLPSLVSCAKRRDDLSPGQEEDSCNAPLEHSTGGSNDRSASNCFGSRVRGRSREREGAGLYDHDRRCSAMTRGEVHFMLMQSRQPLKGTFSPDTVDSFKNALLKKYSKLEYAWEEMDSNGNGTLQFHEFVRACRSMSFAGNLRKIFDGLTCGGVAMDPAQLDPKLPGILQKRFEERLNPRTPPSRLNSARSISSSLSRGRKSDDESLPMYRIRTRGLLGQTMGEVNALLQCPAEPEGPAADARCFRHALLKKFYKLEYAWEEMAANSDDKMVFRDFVRACRKIQFQGNLRKIFLELTGGGSVLTAERLDPRLPAELASLRMSKTASGRSEFMSRSDSEQSDSEGLYKHGKRVAYVTQAEVQNLLFRLEPGAGPPSDVRALKNAFLKKFGRLEFAWEELARGQDSLTFIEFVRACREMDFSGSLRKIFDELGGGADIIQPASLDPDLPAELARMRAAIQKKRLTSRASSGDMSLRLNARRASTAVTKDRSDTPRKEALDSPRPHPLPTKKGATTFKDALLERYSSLEGAWAEIAGGDDHLHFDAFVVVCGDLSFQGELRAIFNDLSAGAETLQLAHLDPRLADDRGPLRSSRTRFVDNMQAMSSESRSNMSKDDDAYECDFEAGSPSPASASTSKRSLRDASQDYDSDWGSEG